MKALVNAILDGISFFVLCVFVSCVMMAIVSRFTEIDAATYKYLGWTIPMFLGAGKFCGALMRQTKWYKDKE